MQEILDFKKYASKFLKIRSKEGVVVPFNLLPSQEPLYNVVHSQEVSGRPVRVIVLKARQQGISSFCIAYSFWKAVTTRNYNCVVLAHDRDTSERLLEIAGIMYDELPQDVKPMRRYRSKSEILFENPKETERHKNPGLRSRIEIKTAGHSVSGRGLTIHSLHCSEVSSYERPDELLASLSPAVPLSPGTQIFLESTGSLTSSGRWFKELWEASKRGETPYTPVFIPWFVNPEYSLPRKLARVWLQDPLTTEEIELMKKYGLSKYQIAWRRYKIAEFPGGERDFNREFPSEDKDVWLGVGVPFLDSDTCKLLQSMKREPILKLKVTEQRMFTSNEPNFLVWEMPQDNTFYVIGVDTASGTGGSYSVAQVIRVDYPKSTLVASFRDKIDPVSLAGVVHQIAKMYNEALLSIEVNGGGISTQHLLREKGYYKFFRWRYLDHVSGDLPSKKVGWETNATSKPLMMQHFKYVLERGLVEVPCEATINELVNLIDDERGAACAPPGENDDLVMALAIAVYTGFLERKAYAWLMERPEEYPKEERATFRWTLENLLGRNPLEVHSDVY